MITPRTMLRLFVALVAAAFLSAALAAGHLTVVDSSVDYTDRGDNDPINEVYLGMAFVDDDLVLTLDDATFDGAMPKIDFDVPDLERRNTLGNDIGATLADVTDMRWVAVGADVPTSPALHEVIYRHLDLSLADGVTMYDAAFSSMGFTTSVADTAADSVKVATYTHGDTVVTIRFHSLGHELEVDLTVL